MNINQVQACDRLNRIITKGLPFSVTSEPGWNLKFRWDDWEHETDRKYTISALFAENPKQSRYKDRGPENYRNLSKTAVENMDKAVAQKYANFQEPKGDYRAAVIGVYDKEKEKPDPEFYIGVRMEDGKAVAVVPYFYNSVLPMVTTTIDYQDRIIGSMLPGVVEWVEGEMLDRFDGFMYNVGRMLTANGL